MAQEWTPLMSCGPDAIANEVPKKKWSDDRNEALRTFAEEHGEVAKAASLLRDASLLTKSTSATDYTNQYYVREIETDIDSRSIYNRILQSGLFRAILEFSVFGLVLLSFFEPPSWCRDFNDGDEDPLNGCETALAMKGQPAFYSDDTEDETQYYYPNSGTNFLTLQQSLRWEVFFLFVLFGNFLIHLGNYQFSLKKYYGMEVYTSARDNMDDLTIRNLKITSGLRLLRMASILALIGGIFSLPITSERPFALFLRIIVFITYRNGARDQFINAAKMIPALLSISFILFLVILFYGLIGVAAFFDTQEGSEFFSNLIEAMWTLWTSMTSVIYPDVMMAAYNENRFTALYFVSYMTMTFFFLQNVILALVCNAYENSVGTTQKLFVESRKKSIEEAFQLLDKDNLGYVTRMQVMTIFLILNEDYEEIRTIPEHDAELLFAILDKDGTDRIELDEFLNFGTVLLLEFEKMSEYSSWIEKTLPELAETDNYKIFKATIQSAKFDKIVDIVIFLNTLLVVGQSYAELSGNLSPDDSHTTDGVIDTPWEVLEAVFTGLYVLEMLTKLSVMGWRKYSARMRNIFDGLITILALATTIYVYYPNRFNDARLIRIVVITRVFRIFRLIMAFDQFQVFSRTFLGVLPAANTVMQLLFCIMYIFSAIGMHLYGGLITRDPQNATSNLLQGTDFADCLYWANNFNDLLSGINVTFNFLVINNWNEMETGILAVSQTKMCRWFFFFFFVCGVLLAGNLVIAVIIDTFIEELSEEEDDGTQSVMFLGRRLVFDSKNLANGDEKFEGEYVATLKTKYKSEKNERQILLDLFKNRRSSMDDE